jgi:hypothetical protein
LDQITLADLQLVAMFLFMATELPQIDAGELKSRVRELRRFL